MVRGKTDIEKPMKFNFVIEWDEPKEQVYEAMTLNAKELTNLIKSPLTPDKERQLKEIIKNKEQLDKIKPFWGEFLNWGSMQKLLNFDRKDKDVKKWINDKVVNNYCKGCFAQQDETRCQQKNGRKRSWFISSYFLKICSMRRMSMQHFVGGTIMKTFLDRRRRHLGIIFSI